MVAIERVQPRARVEIDGAGRTLLGGSCTLGSRAAFSTATLTLDPGEGRPTPGQRVRLWAGYNASLHIIFTGEIDAGGVSLSPNELEVRCTGILARTRERIGEPPTIVDGEAEQEYLLTWEGATASTIIGDILDAYGITEYALEEDGRTYGNIEPVGLTASDPGWSLIEQLDEIEGYKTWDGPDGVVRRTPFAGIPAGTGQTFTEGVDLYTGRLDESRTGTYNRVIISGLPQVGTTGVDFVPVEELSAPSPWIPTPPTYRAYTWDSPLLETAEDCGEVAARKLGELNRLRGELPFELALGDATLRPGMSIAVDSDILDVRTNVRFWVIELVHSFDAGFNTSGTLLMASEGTGWSPNQAPVAVIDASAKVETLADASELVTVTLDGSASYDPELGTAGIVSYAWTGTPTNPTSFDSGMRASVVYVGGIPDGATITLTVTDDLGKTGSATIQPAAGGVPLKRRDLISAELTRLQTTRDGGATWNDVEVSGSPIAAVGVTEFAAAEYGFAWDADGELYRVNADDTGELVLSGAGVTACGITLTNGDPAQKTGRVWAAGAGGAVYRSRADGDAGTWEPVTALPNGQPATYILESPFAEGDVEAAAGNVYYRSFDNGGSWTAQYTHPNTALVAARVASGFGKGWVGFAGPGPTSADSGASRLQERTDSVDLDFPASAKPASVVGLALDPFEDTIYALDVDGGGVGRAWRGDSAAGGLLADTGGWDILYTPRHMIRDGTSAGYLYIAAVSALLKSVDGLSSVRELKALGGGAEGMMIGYGAERAALTPLTLGSAAGEERALYLWDGGANADPPAGWYAAEYDDTAWGVSAASTAPGTPIPGTDKIWGLATPDAMGAETLFRRSFAVAPGRVRSATLTVRVDNLLLDAYLNGVRLGGPLGDSASVTTHTFDVAAHILPGRTNTLALRTTEVDGGSITTWASYLLEIR